jgi:glycine/D-amino acid oxidase-like deaminating enzyme/nitrite reductase/ring-hydroxylating ferredoxin subunit
MEADSEQSTSIWMAESLSASPPPTGHLEADVCVVGAGIAGLTTAYLLGRAGRSVVVLDRGPVGGGQTGRTTAHLTNAIDDRYLTIERLHGATGSRLAAASHTAAIACIERIVRNERIACEFERLDGYLLPGDQGAGELLARELDAARRAGLRGVVRVDRAPIPGFDSGPCLRFPRQGQFHPLKYLGGLARSVEQDHGRIFGGATVEEISGGAPARIRTAEGATVSADAVVVATNTPINDLVAIHTKQAAYLTYVVGLAAPGGTISRALFWDTADPYHYVRLASDAGGEILIVGGEDHKTGQRDDGEVRYARLEAWARERFEGLGEVRYQWSGQIMETIDGLAFLGRNPVDAGNVFVATGDSGQGMTHGTIAGMLISDLILGRSNPWSALYDPSRKTLRAAGEFLKEAANMAWQYTDWLKPGEESSVDAIAPGAGAVLRRGLTKVAVYRDPDGVLHEMSAVCPHLGCIVDWNSSEHTWDCPCHGSRFDQYGQVLNGPAIDALKPLRQLTGDRV